MPKCETLMRFKISFLILMTCCISCHRSDEKPGAEKFNAERWSAKEGRTYLHRDAMVTEIMSDRRFRLMKHGQLMDQLGEPDRADNNYLFYTVDQQFLGPLPLHTKTLVIKMYPDSTVEWMKIHK